MEHRRQEYEYVIDEWVLNERDRIAPENCAEHRQTMAKYHRTAFIKELPSGGSFFALFLLGICRKDAPGFPRKTGPLLA